MLRHLHIENYALIDHLDQEFYPGFNLLTGETGSGKSIVVDAVTLLLGGRASSEVIRSGAERARISGMFSPSSKAASVEWQALGQLLAEAGLDSERNLTPEGSERQGGRREQSPQWSWDGNEELIVQRDILPGGKSRVFVNHQLATAALLKAMAPYLAEVHGQNEQQELFLPSAQLEMLDRFGGFADLSCAVGEAYRLWKSLRERQEDLARRQEERLRQLDLLKFQEREIREARVRTDEDRRLEEEKLLLVNAARIQSSLASAYDLLYDSSASAAASLHSARRHLEAISPLDASLKPLLEGLAEAKVSIEDAALSLRDRLSGLETSPQRLEEVENRLAALDRLKRKYGPALEDVIQFGERVAAELREAESNEALGASLENQVKEAAAAYRKSAGELSRRRAEAARELQGDLEKELKGLAMAGTVFEARLTSAAAPEEWARAGMDRAEFLNSPNPGEPLRPLARIASGGEVSRVMLAIETIADTRRGSGGRDHTLVFDEVDAGIGGRAAETVGRKLRQLGERRQVLCVTHLPQIASFAQHHFRVEKGERNGRTVTRLQHLEKSERTQELARMLSGSRVTDAVMKHAEQLLKANS